MKTENQEQLINDKSHSRAETLTDLPVAEEQADEIKGGEVLRYGGGVDVLIGGTGADR